MASGTGTQHDWREWVGQLVAGKFRLQQYLGASDHSAVYLTERGPGEKVAIKLFAAERMNGEAQLARWKIVSTLTHPNLLRLYEFGKCQFEGRAFLYTVTQRADEDLSQVVPHRPLTPEEAKGVLQATLSALAYIHQHGFVHGRIKPSNIMAVREELKISSDSIGDPKGVGWGWPDIYSAPEYASGMNAAADVWSVGMTLAEVMTQKLITAKEGSDAPVPPTLPQPFFDIARHALRRDPRQRWTLTQISEALASTPAAVPQEQKQIEPMRKRPRYLVPVLAIAALVVVLIVTAFLRRSSGPVAPASESTQTTAVDTPRPATAQPKPSPRTASPGTGMPAASPQPGGGEVQQRVAPAVSRSALHTITGHIRISIKAKVDGAGNVTEASFATRGPSQYFARAAMNAAKQWKFTPPLVDGKSVASRWIIRFKFSRSAVDDSAEQVSR